MSGHVDAKDGSEQERQSEESSDVMDDMAALQGVFLEAAAEGDIQVVRSLLRRGLSVNVQDDDGKTALYHAAFWGKTEVVELLLEHHADSTISNVDGWTPLMEASVAGHIGVVKRLIRYGCRNINRGNARGEHALFLACWGGEPEIVRALLLAGADPDLPDEDGMTPRQIAEEEGVAPGIPAAFQWFKNEMERPYILHRARSLLEMEMIDVGSGMARLPDYLRRRRAAGVPMPHLDLNETEEGQGEVVGVGQPERSRQAHIELLETLKFISRDLNAELYHELLQGLM